MAILVCLGYATPVLKICVDTRTALMPPARKALRPFAFTALSAILALLVVGCTRPADRPIEGARPGSVASANSDALLTSSPIALAVPTPAGVAIVASPDASPVASPVASPAPSPTAIGRGPIISTIQPQANASVPAGPVTISTRVSATSDITEATLFVDGQATRHNTSGDARTPTYSATVNLPAGQHQARILVRDDQGRAGGYTWTFTVGRAQSSPAAKR